MSAVQHWTCLVSSEVLNRPRSGRSLLFWPLSCTAAKTSKQCCHKNFVASKKKKYLFYCLFPMMGAVTFLSPTWTKKHVLNFEEHVSVTQNGYQKNVYNLLFRNLSSSSNWLEFRLKVCPSYCSGFCGHYRIQHFATCPVLSPTRCVTGTSTACFIRTRNVPPLTTAIIFSYFLPRTVRMKQKYDWATPDILNHLLFEIVWFKLYALQWEKFEVRASFKAGRSQMAFLFGIHY